MQEIVYSCKKSIKICQASPISWGSVPQTPSRLPNYCNTSCNVYIGDAEYEADLMAASYHQCCVALQNFISLCNYLGVPIAPEKTVGPQTVLIFAGIELDTNTMETQLPNNKITKTKTFLSDFLRHKKVSLKETQSLIGLLNFACSVVVPGRAFLRRLIDLTKGGKLSHSTH